jgi:hypothetical protein
MEEHELASRNNWHYWKQKQGKLKWKKNYASIPWRMLNATIKL